MGILLEENKFMRENLKFYAKSQTKLGEQYKP